MLETMIIQEMYQKPLNLNLIKNYLIPYSLTKGSEVTPIT